MNGPNKDNQPQNRCEEEETPKQITRREILRTAAAITLMAPNLLAGGILNFSESGTPSPQCSNPRDCKTLPAIKEGDNYKHMAVWLALAAWPLPNSTYPDLLGCDADRLAFEQALGWCDGACHIESILSHIPNITVTPNALSGNQYTLPKSFGDVSLAFQTIFHTIYGTRQCPLFDELKYVAALNDSEMLALPTQCLSKTKRKMKKKSSQAHP